MAKDLVADKREQKPVTPGPEHNRLNIFAGEWRTEGQTIADSNSPSVPIRSSDVYEQLPGGFFIVHRWNGRVGDDDVHGIEVIGYDAERHAYRTHFFDNTGGSGSEVLTVRERTWTWLGEHVMGVAWHRCISVVSEDGNTMRARHERSTDGKTWMPWMDVTLSRIK
jgi:hypothetical protein